MRFLPQGADPALGAIVAEGFLSRLSFGIVNFAYPLYAKSLGMSLLEIGTLTALPVLASLVVKPATGWIADRYGLKRSFVGAICLRSLVGLLYLFAVTPFHLVAIRLLYGVSQGVRDPALNALIAEHGGKKSIASAFAWYATAKNVAGSLGLAVGGYMLALLSNDFQAVFIVVFVLSMLPLAAVSLGLKEPDAGGPAPQPNGGKASKQKPSPDRPEDPASRRAREGALVREYAFVREFGLTAAEDGGSGSERGIIPVGTWLYPSTTRGADGAGSPAGSAAKRDAAEAGTGTGKISTRTIISYVALGVLISGTAQMLKGGVFIVMAKDFAHLTEAEIATTGLVSGAVALGAGPAFGWISDRFGRKLVLSIRGIANSCSSLIFVFFPSFIGWTVGDSIDEIGKAAFKPAWGTLMAEVAGLNRARRARTMSYLSVAEDIGEFLGPTTFSFVASFWLLPAALAVPAAFGLRVLLAGVTELYASRLHRPSEVQAQMGRLKPVELAPNRRS